MCGHTRRRPTIPSGKEGFLSVWDPGEAAVNTAWYRRQRCWSQTFSTMGCHTMFPIYGQGNVLRVRQPLLSNCPCPSFCPHQGSPPFTIYVGRPMYTDGATGISCGCLLDRVCFPSWWASRDSVFFALGPATFHAETTVSRGSSSYRWGVRLASVGRPARRRRPLGRPAVGLVHCTGHHPRGHYILSILATPFPKGHQACFSFHAAGQGDSCSGRTSCADHRCAIT